KRFLSLNDWIWSLPLSCVAFFMVGVLMQWYFGDGAGVFDPAYIQKAFLAAFYMVIGNAVVQFGMWFNMRGFHRYFYSRKSSVKQDFKTLTSWQKIFFFIFS